MTAEGHAMELGEGRPLVGAARTAGGPGGIQSPARTGSERRRWSPRRSNTPPSAWTSRGPGSLPRWPTARPKAICG